MSHQSSRQQHGRQADHDTPSGSQPDGAMALSSFPPDVPFGHDVSPRLLAAISQAVFACNFDGAIIYWNPAAEQFYGWTADEALGQTILEMIADAAIRGSVIDVLAIMRERQTWVREVTVQHKDGTEFPAEVSLSQIRDDAGVAIGIVAISADISQRKQAERERETLLAAEHIARIEAGYARFRAEQLLEISAAFSRARTPAEVMQATIEQGMAALGADAGMIALMTGSDDALEIAHTSGYPPETVDPWRNRPIPITADLPITDAVLKQEAIWIPSREDLLEQYPALHTAPYTYSAGTVSIPLIANNRVLGILGLSYAEKHEFPAAERVFADTLARLCAQALERARLYAMEQEARHEGAAAQRRAVGLFRLTAALSRALTPQEVASAAIEQGLGALEVDAGLIALMTADGSALDVIQTDGYPSDIVERWHAAPISLDHPVPIALAVKHGEPIWVQNR